MLHSAVEVLTLIVYGEALLCFYLKEEIKNLWTQNSQYKQPCILTSETGELVYECVQFVWVCVCVHVKCHGASSGTWGCQDSWLPRVWSARDAKMDNPCILWTHRHGISHDHPDSTMKMVPGLPWWPSGWESSCQCRGHGFDPWSGRIPHATTKPVCHNYCACALELVSHNYWALMPQLLKPACLEPMFRNRRSHRNEKPVHHGQE